jgi:hypothetical protein
LVTTVCIIPIVVGSAGQPEEVYSFQGFEIARLQAKLFYHDLGMLSDDVLARSDSAPGSIPVIGGDEAVRSNATLIIVEVWGPAGTMDRRLGVELIVTSRSRTLLDRTVRVQPLQGGKFFAGFWIYDTGCEPLALRARLVNGKSRSEKTANLIFTCAE